MEGPGMKADARVSRTSPSPSLAEIERASLAAAVEQAADSFVMTDVDGKILYVNPAFTAMTGYTSQEAVGQNPRILKSGRHPKAFYKEMWDTIRSGQVWHGVVTNHRKDGVTYDEEMQIAPVHNSSGAAIGYVAIKRDVTERRAAQETQAFLAAIVENCEDSIIAWTPDGIVRAFNRGAEAVFGYSSEEAIGQHMSVFVPAERLDALEQLADKLRRGESFSQYEGLCLRKDGARFPASVTGFPIRNSAGEVVAICSFLRDITGRREAERKRRESEERFRSIFEDAPSGMCVTGMDGRFVQVNEALSKILGYSAEELLGTPWSRLSHPDDLKASLEKVKLLLEGQGSYIEDEPRNIHRSGHVLWVRVRVSLVRDGSGSPLYFVSHLEDITERKRAEEALRKSEQYFREMADSCPSMMWVTGPTGEIDFLNRAYREFSGLTCDEAHGHKWRSLLHPGDAPEYLEKFDRAMREHTSFSAEGRVRRADGEWRMVGSRGEPRFSAEGEYLGHIGLRADITERMKAEQLQEFQHSLIRAIHEGSLDGILVVNPDDIIVSHNKKMLDVWKISLPDDSENLPDNIVGTHQQPLLSAVLRRAKDPETYLQRIEAAQNDPDVADRSEVALKDGRTLERYSACLRSDNGDYLGRARFFRDITERKQAEQTLKESEERFRVMADGCPMPMWVTGADGGIQFINRALREFTGAGYEQVEGDNWQLFSHPDDAQAFFEESRRVVRERVPLKTETRFRRADGEWRWLAVIGEPRFSSSGEFLGHIGLGMDITERKQAEQTLIESENQFRIMADGCPIGIWISDAQGATRFVNRTYRVFCGLTSEDVDPDMWLSIIHPDDRPDFVASFERAQREHTPFKSEQRSRRFDGEWRWVESYAEPRFSADKEFLGFSGTSKDITDRKQAEQALKETEERFRIMADSCPLGIWVTDAQGKTLFANRAYRRFCGIASEEVEQDGWLFLLHPDDAPAILEAFDRAIQEHTRFSGEQRCRRADGQWRWLESYAEPRFSPDGEFLGLVGTSKDITKRKQTEQALQTSEERFRQLTENIDEVFWLMEPGSDEILYVSPAYERIWGRTCASLYQNPASRLEAIHPDDLEQSRKVFARQMQGESVESEYRIETPDGQQRWIRSRAFPIRNRSGQLIRVAGIAEDISERKRHEEELNRAREEAEAANRRLAAQHAVLDNERRILRTFIDNVPDFMYIKDLESRFVVANKTVARWAGVERQEDLIGKTDFDLCPRELAMNFYEDEQRVIRTRQAIFDREEVTSMDASSGPHYTLTTKVPLFDSEGHVTGIAGMGRDITSRKAMEDALRESNRELQESIDRANQLAFEAEAANRSKSEFLANMSHEIRTPMNGVLGMNGLLLNSDLTPDQRHYAEVVDASAKSLLTVIDDILDFSKVEAGKLEIDTLDFNLHVLMGDFAEMMSERLDEKQLEFVCAVAPDVAANLQGDPGRLRQVLLNLVGNAIKFTHHGEVVVRVGLISETDAEVRLRFSVRDTGIGIPADKQQMLFNCFTQVDASTTRRYGGTGLGLAICKKLVELMGGKIGVESKEGVGSEFWFTLRLGKQPAGMPADCPKVPVKGTRILVVDDNATNREVLTAQMQSWGAAVIAVESGATALACLRYAVTTGTPFQVAVLDMMMPGMDGATLGRAILADDTLNPIPLVMMTSLGQRGDAIRFKEIGFAAYLTKPVRQSDLYDCLVTVLTGEQQKQRGPLITRHSLQKTRRGNARILLVEDNSTNQEVAKGMLHRMGWHADVAPDGKEAVRALETKDYDLVLMDVQMPVMDGYEATRRIRDPKSMALNHDVPIIATTAHAMAGDAEKCLAAGMSDYIAKPIDPKILEKRVEKWLARKRHETPAASPAESAGENNTPIPAMPSAALVFNRENFLERMMGDEEFAHEVVAEFVGELPTLLSALKKHVAESDLESIWKQAHKIKGSAANVGGEALRDVALKVEQAGKTGNSAEVAHWVPELGIQAARLIDALQCWQIELGLTKL
jgi:PAS domain S-box-containing protein